MQVVDTKSLLLALHFCHEAQNPYFRLCYNSLGAYGTVNHLHFQVTYSYPTINWYPHQVSHHSIEASLIGQVCVFAFEKRLYIIGSVYLLFPTGIAPPGSTQIAGVAQHSKLYCTID